MKIFLGAGGFAIFRFFWVCRICIKEIYKEGDHLLEKFIRLFKKN
jgi:hypothetical protein